MVGMLIGDRVGWIRVPDNDLPDELRWCRGSMYTTVLACGCSLYVKGPR
jgi:hypothetical protein